MSRITMDARPVRSALVVCALVIAGCSGLPRIDPSGQRFFLPPEGSADPCRDPFLAPYQPPQVSVPGLQAADPGYQPSGPAAAYGAPNYEEVPGGNSGGDGVKLLLNPRQTIAPVGTEVVLLAGVLGIDQYLRTNQRVEWTIAPGGVGQFVDLGGKSATDWLVGDFSCPRKISPTAAVGTTTRKYLRLTRGTANTDDDVRVKAGEAWITVSSPAEGICYVTAYSPCVAAWVARKQTAVIHWVDAQWRFPPPAINQAGSKQVFTTAVTRQTDGSPCTGWVVRYEVLDGPSAGFAPDGVQAVEVPTDTAGQASVEIYQLTPSAGTNRIGIQVIRPATLDATGGRRLIVGSGVTTATWSAADIAVRKSGPATAALGTTLTYRIDVTNPGDMVAEGVVLTDEIPEGMSYQSSNPSGNVVGRTIRWQLGQLLPGETRPIEVRLSADRQGGATSCAEAAIPSGLKARDCVSTTVSTATVDVKIEGPTEATVGQEVTFTIVVTNVGQSLAAGLMIKDRFDAGLQHAVAKSPIEKDLGADLAPGQSQRIGVAFRVTGPGRHCQTVEIMGPGGVLGSARACVTAKANPAAVPSPQPQPPATVPPPPSQPGPQPPTTVLPQPQPGPQPPAAVPPPVQPRSDAEPRVSLKLDGPSQRTVGETAEFTVEVVNTSTETLEGFELVATLAPNFDPSMATEGYRFEGESLHWTIQSLASGEAPRFPIHARCTSPAQSACCRVQLLHGDRVLAEDEVCLAIESAPMFSPADLSMTITDRHDPIVAGKELTYEIQVDNNGRQPDRQVVLVVTVPPAMQAVRLQTVGPTGYEIDGSTIRFNPVDLVEPGGSIVYRVRVQAKLPGQASLRARLTSQGLRQPLVAEEETLINAVQ